MYDICYPLNLLGVRDLVFVLTNLCQPSFAGCNLLIFQQHYHRKYPVVYLIPRNGLTCPGVLSVPSDSINCASIIPVVESPPAQGHHRKSANRALSSLGNRFGRGGGARLRELLYFSGDGVPSSVRYPRCVNRGWRGWESYCETAIGEGSDE